MAAALTVTVPPLFYIVAFRHSITHSEHLWSLLLLVSAPLVLLALLEVSMPYSSEALCNVQSMHPAVSGSLLHTLDII